MKKPKMTTVNAEVLKQIGEEAFPDVSEECPTCRGTGKAHPTVHGVETRCPTCGGMGRITREMTAREEHYWILHLLQGYQLR